MDEQERALAASVEHYCYESRRIENGPRSLCTICKGRNHE